MARVRELICQVSPAAKLGGQADANKGHAFGIFMALVGALRTFGAPAPLTLGVRPMHPNKLASYKGQLSKAEIAYGINLAIANGRRLANDAELLLNAGSFPTAASLAALSIEESGKVSILRQLAIATTPDGISDAWKAYRSHTKKNSMWVLPDLVMQGACTLDDLKSLVSDEAEHPFILDQLKQLGFYTDCLGEKQWSTPDEIVDESLARPLVDFAKILTRKVDVTVEEIDLWVEHLGGRASNNIELMKQGLINWYSAMQEKRLLPSGENKIAKFINAGMRKEQV